MRSWNLIQFLRVFLPTLGGRGGGEAMAKMSWDVTPIIDRK